MRHGFGARMSFLNNLGGGETTDQYDPYKLSSPQVFLLSMLIFLAIVVRVFVKLLDEEDNFKLLAAAGLATQFGAQAIISMAVNTGLAPSKGMTLPFISYGGSSLIALSIGMGLLLAFTRRNPFLTRSPYVTRWSAQ